MQDNAIQTWLRQLGELNAVEPLNQFFKGQEVWNCLLGLNVGHEQNSDRRSFLRPVLVIQRFNAHTFWGVPLSTKIPTDSPHHHLFKHEGVQYSALITQLRTLDSRRLLRRLYVLDDANFYAIQLRLGRIMLRQQNRTPG
jgi:mRNA-degrading endonuclease toxin of MazEF toxin-antitoxin module